MTEVPDNPINADKDKNKEQHDYFCPECNSFVFATYEEMCCCCNTEVSICKYDEGTDTYIEVQERGNHDY